MEKHLENLGVTPPFFQYTAGGDFRASKIRALRAQNYVLILETGRVFEGRNLAKFRG